MNRDKSVILGLLLLLAGSVALNIWLWRRPAPENAVVSGTAAEPVARASGTRERGDPVGFELVDNPELKGRLGRLVLTFADAGGSLEGTRTAIMKPGKQETVKTAYGPVAVELVPAEYDLEVNGRALAGVRIESGKDTRVASGVLRFHGAEATRFVVYLPGATDSVFVTYGNSLKGLPVGDYEVEVNGVRESVRIEAGQVTDF